MLARAAQHLYGNVEREESPSGVRGFQPLGYSHSSLTALDVEELERNLAYSPGEGHVSRTLFFMLSGGKAVVSRVVPIGESDKFGRKGRYVAHSLVLGADDFTAVGRNPFTMLALASGKLVTTIEAALHIEGRQGMEIPEIALSVTRELLEEVESGLARMIRRWEPDEVRQLLHYGLQAPELAKERVSLALMGDEQARMSTLKAVFALIPEQRRGACSFDTYAAGSNPAVTYFWARGYPVSTSVPSHFVAVDTALRQVKGTHPAHLSPYEKWALASLKRDGFENTWHFKEPAWELERLLTGAASVADALRDGPPEMVAMFFNENRDLIASKLQENLAEQLGTNLGQRLSRVMLARLPDMDASAVLGVLLRGVAAADIAPDLVASFREVSPSRAEMAEVETLAAASQHPGLLAMCSLWRRDYDAARLHLSQLTGSGRLALIAVAVESLDAPLVKFLSEDQNEAILEWFANAVLRRTRLQEQVPEIVEELCHKEHFHSLGLLAPIVGRLDGRQITRLAGVMTKYRERIPQDLLMAVHEQHTSPQSAVPSGTPLTRLIRKFFPRERDEQ